MSCETRSVLWGWLQMPLPLCRRSLQHPECKHPCAFLRLPLHAPPCRQYHQLEGREAQLRQLIEQQYAANLRRFAGRAVDERAETHLQVGLGAATERQHLAGRRQGYQGRAL